MAEPLPPRALEKFTVYLRILQAYNIENFQKTENILSSYSLAFVVTVPLVVATIAVILGFWHLLDNPDNVENIVAFLPIFFAALKELISYASFVPKNRIIQKTIDRIQQIVDQREFEFSNRLSFST